jgi:hypothetical protein
MSHGIGGVGVGVGAGVGVGFSQFGNSPNWHSPFVLADIAAPIVHSIAQPAL